MFAAGGKVLTLRGLDVACASEGDSPQLADDPALNATESDADDVEL